MSHATAVRETQAYSFHVKRAHVANFAGFLMPIWYSSIAEEHLAVRNHAGLFDVSHMGRFRIRGRKAFELIDTLVPTDLSSIQDGKAFYSALCNESGGIVDDIITMRFREDEFIMVVNAANIEKDLVWIRKHNPHEGVEIKDISQMTALFALQGPDSEAILQPLVQGTLSRLGRFSFLESRIGNSDVIISRTGYTGEDGLEILVRDTSVERPQGALQVWNDILQDRTLMPCGLGARDTLRLEAGLCLYGEDIDESTTPLEANLKFVVDLEKGEFIGRDALIRQAQQGAKRLRMGLMTRARSVLRRGYVVGRQGRVVGSLTSGTFSPLLKTGIGMGYLEVAEAIPGRIFNVDVKGKPFEAISMDPPFYDKNRYGWRRLK